MVEITIARELKEKCPALVLGCIQASVTLKEKEEGLLVELHQLTEQIRESMVLEQVASLPAIVAARETYKKLGKSPSRYRVSSEALFRRVLQGKGLYQINNVVDINNFISLQSHHSVGTYDLAKIIPPIVFTIAPAGETYQGIGKELLNIENLPVFTDSVGSFGSPTSDSQRAMITLATQKILMNIISFSGQENLGQHLDMAKELLVKYADAQEIETSIIE